VATIFSFLPFVIFKILVLPGRIAIARMKESDAPEDHLKPGQTIVSIVFEGLCFILEY